MYNAEKWEFIYVLPGEKCYKKAYCQRVYLLVRLLTTCGWGFGANRDSNFFDFPVYFKFFIGLFALVNPVGIIPVFISMTSYQTVAARNKTNLTANLSVAIILWTALFLGDGILQLFGISIDSFRIAGGIWWWLLPCRWLAANWAKTNRTNRKNQKQLFAKVWG